jgi:hypothetical protein
MAAALGESAEPANWPGGMKRAARIGGERSVLRIGTAPIRTKSPGD